MRRPVFVAIMLAVLMATGMPAAAFNTASSVNLASDAALEVGSKHTTASDFNAGTLDDTRVDGSGTSASVVIAGIRTVDDFEDGDVAEWGGAMELNQTAASGTYNGLVNATGDSSTQTGDLDIPDTTGNVTFELRTDNFDALSGVRLYNASGGRAIEVGFHKNSNFYYYDGSVHEFGSASADTYHSIKLADLNFSNNSYDIYIDGVKEVDNAAFDANADLISSVEVTAATGNSGTKTFIDDIAAGNSRHGRYVSPDHAVDNAEQAWLNTSVTNATADATLQGWDGSTWVDVQQAGISQTKNQTVALSGTYSQYRWDTTLTELNHQAVSRWDANEGTGTTVNDKVDGNHGKFNETDWDTSIYKTGGASVYIDSTNNDLLATDDYVFFKQNEVVNNSQFTWTGWVRPAANDSNQAILNSWNGTDGIRLHLRQDGSVSFNVTLTNGTVTEVRGGNLDTDAWHLITAGRDKNGQMFLRINKTTVDSKAANGLKMADSDAKMVWGINSNDKDSQTYLGHIDEAGLWNRTLAPEETRLLFNNPAAFNESTAKIHDEGVLFNARTPNATLEAPADGAMLDSSTATLTANVTDADFNTTQGDDVTTTIYLKEPGETSFSAVETRTQTSNGTVSVDISASAGGTYEWYVEATDDYGDATTSATQTFEAPGELTVRNETQPSQLVNQTTVDITYYYGDETVRRSADDATVDLTGLPVDEPIIALIKAEGYHTRAVAIKDIYQQQDVFLLNESHTSHNTVFDLTDPTGQFPRAETVLEVQRDIELNGTTEWRTVAGDQFGAQGVVTDLQADERYRLIITNLETNEQAVLGSFTPVASRTITLEAQAAEVNVSATSDTAIGYDATRNAAGDSIVIEYADPTTETNELKFMIHERYNESNVLLKNQTFSNLGNISYAEPLSASEQNKSWAVKFYVDRTGDGQYDEASVVVGQGPRNLVPTMDGAWTSAAGVFVLLITALLFSQLNLGVGALTTASTGGVLWYVGLLDGVTTGPAIVLGLALGVVVYYQQGAS